MNHNNSTPDPIDTSNLPAWSLILNNLPTAWVLTPVLNKRPLRPNWQSEEAITRTELIALMASGQLLTNDRGKKWRCMWTGVGLRLGEISGGLLAIDCDGERAIARLKEMAGGELPHTVSWTSGKPGRQQLLISIPQEHWGAISNKKIDCGNGEYLEFRWNGCQSVLPPSVHPETGAYQWINSPTDTEVLDAPDWLLDQINNGRHAALKNNTSERIDNSSQQRDSVLWKNDLESSKSFNQLTDIEKAIVCLEHLAPSRADNYKQWVDVGMALHSCSPTLLPEFIEFSGFSPKFKDDLECMEKWESIKEETNNPLTLGSLIYWAKEDSPEFAEYQSQAKGVYSSPKKNVDNPNPDLLGVLETSADVYAILGKNLNDFEESYELELLFNKSVLDKRSFWLLVKSLKCSMFEVEKSDLVRFEKLFQWDNDKLNWLELLPKTLAEAILHDANILCVDPIQLWQYIMPAAASCLGKKVKLNARSHIVPCILWACLVAESGTGKSRAAGVSLSILKELQHRESERYKKDLKEYKKALKDKENKGKEIPEPKPLRKWVFQVTTIQALMKKLAQQAENGSIWARDEISGIFSSLNQFAHKHESEAMECLLELWDGTGAITDRVDDEESYDVISTCLSIAGGIQPAVFRKAFKDKNDANGLQARFLYAAPRPIRQRVVDGYCTLHEILPDLYQSLESFPSGTIPLSNEAYELYKQTVDQIETKIETVSNPAYRNWLRKLGTQILRISLVLHGIECSYDNSKNKRVITPDTFSRAIKFGVYYSQTFDIIQDKISDGSEVSSILVRIHDLALSNPTGGVTIRECARRIRALTHNAKELGVSVGTYTRTLIEKLMEAGKGTLVKAGQALKYQAQIFTKGQDGNNGMGDPGSGNGGLPKNPVSPSPIPTGAMGEPTPEPEPEPSNPVENLILPNNPVSPSFDPTGAMGEPEPLTEPSPSTPVENLNLPNNPVSPDTQPGGAISLNEIPSPLNTQTIIKEEISNLPVSTPNVLPSAELPQTYTPITSQPPAQGEVSTLSPSEERKISELSTCEKDLEINTLCSQKDLNPSQQLTPSPSSPPLTDTLLNNQEIPIPKKENEVSSNHTQDNTRVEIITSSVAFELTSGDRLTLLVDNKYQNSFKFVSRQGDGSLLFENESISKQEKLTQKEVEERFLEFIASSTGSSTPIPLPESEDVRDLAAMFTKSVKKGKETIEEIFELLYTEYIHLARRVWQSLSNTVKGLVAEIAPDVHYCLEDCK